MSSSALTFYLELYVFESTNIDYDYVQCYVRHVTFWESWGLMFYKQQPMKIARKLH